MVVGIVNVSILLYVLDRHTLRVSDVGLLGNSYMSWHLDRKWVILIKQQRMGGGWGRGDPTHAAKLMGG